MSAATGAATSGSAAQQQQQVQQSELGLQTLDSSNQPQLRLGTARGRPPRTATVRHGVLMMDDVDGCYGQHAAASSESEAPRFSLRQAADKWFKQAWSKVAPKRRKLVIRPGGAADLTVAGSSGAAAAMTRSGSTGLQGSGRPAAATGAAVGYGKGPAGAGATGDAVAAYCLVDLTDVEVLSGQMMRVKAAAWRVSVHLVGGCTWRLGPLIPDDRVLQKVDCRVGRLIAGWCVQLRHHGGQLLCIC